MSTLEGALRTEVDAGLDVRVRLVARGALAPVVGEPRSLAAAFRELARNAARASPGGSLEVRVEREEGEIVIRFKDDGPGIPEEIRPHVFDPFFTTSPAGGGVGLGLTLVHFVVRDLAGYVRVEATGGLGTTVVLRIPVQDRRARVGETHPLAWPILATSILLTITSVITDEVAAGRLAAAASVAAGLGAAFELLRAARAFGSRVFFTLLAVGALLAGFAPLLGPPGLRTLADWPFAAAVLLPLAGGLPTRGRRFVGVAALVAFVAAHINLVLRPTLLQGAEASMIVAVSGEPSGSCSRAPRPFSPRGRARWPTGVRSTPFRLPSPSGPPALRPSRGSTTWRRPVPCASRSSESCSPCWSWWAWGGRRPVAGGVCSCPRPPRKRRAICPRGRLLRLF